MARKDERTVLAHQMLGDVGSGRVCTLTVKPGRMISGRLVCVKNDVPGSAGDLGRSNLRFKLDDGEWVELNDVTAFL